jgi:hypothetical protein
MTSEERYFMIPEDIKREHVEAALQHILREGTPQERESTKFDLVYQGKRFPPKYAISLASKYATGSELDPSAFSGGAETNSFLENLGFTIANSGESQIKELLDVPVRPTHLPPLNRRQP